MTTFSFVHQMVRSGDTYDSRTVAWLARLPTRPPKWMQRAVDRFIKRLVADGVWDAVSEIVPCFAHTKQAALEGLKGVVTYAGSTIQNSSVYYHAPGLGLYGNGTSSYVQLNKTPAQLGLSLTSGTMLAFLTSNIATGTGLEVGAYGSSAGQMSLRGSSGVRSGVWTGTSTQIQFGNSIAAGMVGWSRTSQDGGLLFRGETTAVFSQSSASGILPTTSVCISRGGTSGNTYSPNSVGLLAFGAAITAAQYAAFYKAVVRLWKDIQRWDDLQDIMAPVDIGANVWTASTISELSPALTIAQITAPPLANDTAAADYARYPISEASIRPFGFSTTWTGHARLFLWANRSIDLMRNPNDTMGRPITIGTAPNTMVCRPEFTTVERAIGATLAQAAYLLGYSRRGDSLFIWNGVPMGWLDILAYWDARSVANHPGTSLAWDLTAWDALADGSSTLTTDVNVDTGPVMHHAYALANAATVFAYSATNGTNYKVSRDVVLLPIARLPEAQAAWPSLTFTGIDLDFEVADGRTEAETIEMMRWLAKLCDKKNLDLFIDWFPLDSGMAAMSGMTAASVQTIMGVTGVGKATVYAKAAPATPTGDLSASLATQLAAFGSTPKSKIALHAGIGIGNTSGMTVSDATVIRSFLLANSDIRTLIITPNGATPGGDINQRYNQVLGTIIGKI